MGRLARLQSPQLLSQGLELVRRGVSLRGKGGDGGLVVLQLLAQRGVGLTQQVELLDLLQQLGLLALRPHRRARPLRLHCQLGARAVRLASRQVSGPLQPTDFLLLQQEAALRRLLLAPQKRHHLRQAGRRALLLRALLRPRPCTRRGLGRGSDVRVRVLGKGFQLLVEQTVLLGDVGRVAINSALLVGQPRSLSLPRHLRGSQLGFRVCHLGLGQPQLARRRLRRALQVLHLSDVLGVLQQLLLVRPLGTPPLSDVLLDVRLQRGDLQLRVGRLLRARRKVRPGLLHLGQINRGHLGLQIGERHELGLRQRQLLPRVAQVVAQPCQLSVRRGSRRLRLLLELVVRGVHILEALLVLLCDGLVVRGVRCRRGCRLLGCGQLLLRLHCHRQQLLLSLHGEASNACTAPIA
mmetsp:Transcript_48528/g.92844  ORF Transcript_48528/g.92844 Transcript_48528/m.92844 type:complete len:409 (-) Transcript_48528:384-1610(-)